MTWSLTTPSTISASPSASPSDGTPTGQSRHPDDGAERRDGRRRAREPRITTETPDAPALTRRFLLHLELGKAPGRLRRCTAPYLEVLMRRAPWPRFRIVPPAAACWRSASWPPSRRRAAATRKRSHYTSVSKPPTVRIIQPRGPEDRPGRRAAELHRGLRAHVDLSQADRLHREVDRRHRRQGEEGRRARHALRARAGRGLRDEEGDRQARRGTGRAGPQDGGGGRRRRQGGRGAPRRGQGDPGQVPGRGRPLGHGGQAAHARGQAGRGRPPDPPRVDQPVEVERRRRGTRRRRPSRRRRRNCSPSRPRSPRPRSTSRSPRPTWPWPRARRSGSRPGWATSRSPPPSTA